MATFNLTSIAKNLRQIDICMMVTISKRGQCISRPMSNNRDVKYNGDMYFFTYEKTQKVRDIEANPQVCLNFEGSKDLYISINGKAKLIRNKTSFAEHWNESLSQWFNKGIDTPGMVLIHVKGGKVSYWQRDKQGAISLAKRKS
jgi:general stress protein 26